VDKEISDKIWEDLKKLVVVALEGCEDKVGIEIGRDEVEKQQYIDKTAGMIYGHLLEEIRITVKQFIVEANKRTEKFS